MMQLLRYQIILKIQVLGLNLVVTLGGKHLRFTIQLLENYRQISIQLSFHQNEERCQLTPFFNKSN